MEVGILNMKFDKNLYPEQEVGVDEDLLEELYWEFDSRVAKGDFSDRDIFKGIMRYFAVLAVKNNLFDEGTKSNYIPVYTSHNRLKIIKEDIFQIDIYLELAKAFKKSHENCTPNKKSPWADPLNEMVKKREAWVSK